MPVHIGSVWLGGQLLARPAGAKMAYVGRRTGLGLASRERTVGPFFWSLAWLSPASSFVTAHAPPLGLRSSARPPLVLTGAPPSAAVLASAPPLATMLASAPPPAPDTARVC